MCLSVNNCCCCITLNVGTKIISIVCTMTAAAATVLYGCSAMEEELPPARRLFYIAMAVVAILQFTFGCLLIYGVFKREPKYTWPWTALTWWQAVGLAAMAVAGAVLLNYNRKLEATAEISTVISAYFVYALILFYFASVVNSRRQQMMIENRMETAKRLLKHRVLPNYYV